MLPSPSHKQRPLPRIWFLFIGVSFLYAYSVLFEFNVLDTTSGFQSTATRPSSLQVNVSYPAIDVVYTWVNGSDVKWIAEKKKHHKLFLEENLVGTESKKMLDKESKEINGGNRFKDHMELQHSIRSVLKNAPWVGKIHIVLSNRDTQVPYWLNTSHPKINIVTHADIFQNASYLPTFSSRAIESQLDNIKGLTDNFLYMNDDFLLGAPVSPDDFFLDATDGTPKVFFDAYEAVFQCKKGCRKNMLSNGKCEDECNNPQCAWDLGDCDVVDKTVPVTKFIPGKGSYIMAIRNANAHLTREFGKTPYEGERKPITHLPYLLNRHILRDLKARFHNQFEETASHRFRHIRDMQYAFSYFHYVVHTKVYAPTDAQVWRQAILTASSPDFLFNQTVLPDVVQQEHFNKIRETTSFKMLRKCVESNNNSAVCHQAVHDLRTIHALRLPMRDFEIMGQKDIHFRTLKDDEKKALQKINNLRKNPKKFMCVEDDMHQTYPKVEQAFIQLLEDLFPHPSVVEKNF